ncbi:MAG TPA: hypothetical protein VKT29_01920 [Terriglobales bacterium]|nr:hypothetical protein [Terriglobales bacterium]
MTPVGYLLLALLVGAGLYFLYRVAYQFTRFGGKMLVTCPETHRPAAVKIDNWSAALSAKPAAHHLHLNACSRWPERRHCGQECVCQIEEDPDAHRVWTIAAQWYEGKDCAYCGRTIELSHFDRPPALLNAEKKMMWEWTGLPAENLQDAFSTSVPVCWNCYVTETFIREHPESTVVRPWKHSPPWAKN